MDLNRKVMDEIDRCIIRLKHNCMGGMGGGHNPEWVPLSLGNLAGKVCYT